MHLIPNHEREAEMCQVIGISSVEELFSDIPKHLRYGELKLPDAEPERWLVRRLRQTLGKNKTYDNSQIFLGGGCKPQLVPASVKAVAHRQELINSYTPYQPEVSQGLLQCLFEFQSLMGDITAMDVVNSSMYDGATALGEACLMCARILPKRSKFLVPANLHADKRSVLENYARGVEIAIVPIGYDAKTGRLDLVDLQSKLDDTVMGVYVENPNFFGIFEDQIREIQSAISGAGALLVYGCDVTSLGIMTPPGHLGADIMVAEASAIGGAPALGGPLLGLFGCKKEHVRKMPGRIIGATKDEDGKRGFVMTLQAREQHIRRTKATSNICSNEALLAVQAAIHLTLLGRTGLRVMGLQNLQAGARLIDSLGELGLKPKFSGAVYNEVVIEHGDVEAVHETALASNVHAGLRLARHVPDLASCMLWGSSPVHAPSDYRALVSALQMEVVA